MALLQKRVGDIVDMTPAGYAKVEEYPNVLSADTEPVSSSKRDWKSIHMINLWVGCSFPLRFTR